jgi:hypothetical protein
MTDHELLNSLAEQVSLPFYVQLQKLMAAARADERERCARLHENINPASDEERLNGVPGAGAMGCVIAYRDAIRALN